MRCVDVNVLVYAHRRDLPEHRDYGELLERLANDAESLAIPDLVLSGFARVVTNRRVFVEPSTPEQAWSAIDRLLAAPAAQRLSAGHRHFGSNDGYDLRSPLKK
ncbi:MAG: hypothetical protein KDB70_19265 [Mycobacterium sp.]|nr:hypothetical protein [Mycobacterium sp.]